MRVNAIEQVATDITDRKVSQIVYSFSFSFWKTSNFMAKLLVSKLAHWWSHRKREWGQTLWKILANKCAHMAGGTLLLHCTTIIEQETVLLEEVLQWRIYVPSPGEAQWRYLNFKQIKHIIISGRDHQVGQNQLGQNSFLCDSNFFWVHPNFLNYSIQDVLKAKGHISQYVNNGSNT